ncbi:MAG: signal recognition particle protein [Candidatus Latescibacteria bacterium 4484_107]|nr:MAG: signal recognition particle protein [Candidatus Latescibacteria bacterium 4484_107]
MFDDLSAKLEGVFKKLRRHGKLSESNIKDALREVRRVLLEADVNYKVARTFVNRVQGRAVGQEVLQSITPGQQVIKIVHDELIALMGRKSEGISFDATPPTVVMLVGLQGSGKTTAAAKLAHLFRSKGRRPLLVAADIYRPAAIDQLEVLGRSMDVPVYRAREGTPPERICADGVRLARKEGLDFVVLDTAGRLHVDDEMMAELERIKAQVSPYEILFVADAMTGQDAVRAAREFLNRLNFGGVILTKLDGDARGGAALSIRMVTDRPIKFVGVGEKLDALEVFHPDRMASRILGMGDVVSLVERVQQSVDTEKAQKWEEKLRKEAFTFDDFLEQLEQLKKMGPLDQLIGMIPGVGKAMRGLKVDEKAFVHTEAIVRSMTKEERARPHLINGSRRRRIARGSGTRVQDVNQLMKQFSMMQKMMKNMGKMGSLGKGMLPF